MTVQIPLSVGSIGATLCLDVPGSVLNCAQCAKAFGIPVKQVRQDCLGGKLNAEYVRGGWRIPVQAAVTLYLSEVISEAAEVAANIAKTSRIKK